MRLQTGWLTKRVIVIVYASITYIFVYIQYQLEWGCPNGTKYPPRQPIPNPAILPNRARLQTDGQTDGQGDPSIPP